MSQLVEFSYVTGQTLTAELYAEGSDTITATAASVTQQTNRNNVYRASFTGVAVGVYLIVVKLSGTAVATGWVHIDAASGTFQVMSRADLRAWRGSTPNALNSGRVDSLTGAMAANVITDAAIADNAFTAAKFAASSLNGKGDWLLAATYSVPSIAAAVSQKIAFDIEDNDNGWDAATPTLTVATANAVRSNLTTELARIDVSISSRLALASYTAPANATIAAIAVIAAKLDSTMELDGAAYRFTANALELAPGGGGGGDVNVVTVAGQPVLLGDFNFPLVSATASRCGRIPIFWGEDHNTAENRQITIDGIVDDLTNATAFLTIKDQSGFKVIDALQAVTVDNTNKRCLFNLPRATAALFDLKKSYFAFCQARYPSGNRITVKRGEVELLDTAESDFPL